MHDSPHSVPSTPPTWNKPRRLYEEVAHHLAAAIARRDFVPGDFLPTEQSLAQQFGASRNVVREAIKMLGARGMVATLHGKGSQVQPYHRWQLSDQFLSLILGADLSAVYSVLELRRILEVAIAGLASQRATDDQIAAMRLAIDNEEETLDRPEESVEHDFNFHRLLAESTGNVFFSQVIELIATSMRATALATFHHPGAATGAIAFHREIVNHVAAHEPRLARQAMDRHLRALEAEVQRLIEEGQFSEFGQRPDLDSGSATDRDPRRDTYSSRNGPN